MANLFPYLEALLPEAPARVLLLGCSDATDGPVGAGREIHRAKESVELDPETAPFDAVLWYGDSREDAGAVVACLPRHLNDDGLLIVVVPLPADAATTTPADTSTTTPADTPAGARRRGSLPHHRQVRLREIVRRLSEAGFAIRKDQDIVPQRPGAAGWKILVARRDPFLIRSYRDGDEQAIRRLFRASFHLDRSLDHWRWKYVDNPFVPLRGKSPFVPLRGIPSFVPLLGRPSFVPLRGNLCRISLATGADGAGDQLVAHYGGYPIPIWYDDARGRRTFLALQIGDTMTDPAVRDAGRGKAGLLARTVRHFFALHRDGTFGLFYGFNTGPIQRFCRWFIGGSQDRPVRYLVRDLEPAPPDWQRGGYRVERVEAVGAAWDRFFRRVAPSYRFLVRRDARYLDWRYFKRPDARYVMLAARRFRRLVGWGVFQRRDDRLAWGDALFDPRHTSAAEPILAAALADPELAGARRIEAWFSGGPRRWNEQLAKLGLVTRPEPQGLGMIALADAEPEAFDKLGEMYTTMGDGDLF